MFCPQCETLSFPTPSGHLPHNYKCGYKGPANLKTKIGGRSRPSKATSSTKVESRDYEVIKFRQHARHPHHGRYMCPKCDCVEVYATSSKPVPLMNRNSMLTCKNCGNGWRSTESVVDSTRGAKKYSTSPVPSLKVNSRLSGKLSPKPNLTVPREPKTFESGTR